MAGVERYILRVEAWLAELEAGNGEAAWNSFEQRYRRLILSTIRRLLQDQDAVMDVFAAVCAALTANDFARLRRYSSRSVGAAAVSTWLVVVVRNLAIDWLRKATGRTSHTVPAGLSALHQDIYSALCLKGLSHTEAFEALRTAGVLAVSFPEFLREIRAVRESHPCPENLPLRSRQPQPLLPEIPVPVADPAEVRDLAARLATALATQAPDVRLAVQLFVIDELPAAQVAPLVGWPNAKAVYNRVRRALEAMRAALEREGVGRGDL